MNVLLTTSLLSNNDQVAAVNRADLDAVGVHSLNLIAAPGAGKTSLILATADVLPTDLRIGVIECDIASSIDADTIAACGIPVVQINTGGRSHLDASMVRGALTRLPLSLMELLLIENVGNLIGSTDVGIGAHHTIVVASVTEGYDKPFKYPAVFAAADMVLVNKWDLAPMFEFDYESFVSGVRAVNTRTPILPISCRTGEGMQSWAKWLLSVITRVRAYGA